MPLKKKITNSSVNSLAPEDKRLNDTEISGFHARITPKGRITYYLFYRHNGKQVNCKLGTHPEITPAQARDAAKNASASVVKGVDVHKEKKRQQQNESLARLSTLGAFIEQKYAPWLEVSRPKTAKAELKNLLSNFGHLYSMQIRDVNAWTIEKWRSEKLEFGLSPASVNRRIVTLKGCMSRAVDWGIINSHDLSKVKALPVDNNRIRYLSYEEETRLRKALQDRELRLKEERYNGNMFRAQRGYPLLPDLSERMYCDHLQPIVLLALNTGMRKGEILNLLWDDIDLERADLQVRSGNSKSGKSRHIALNTGTVTMLREWKIDSCKSKWVFEGKDDRPITDIKTAWNAVIKSASIENFRFHDLRHNFASQLVMAEVDLNTVRELLGHSNLEMTLRYAHLAPEHKAQAVAKLESRFN